MNMGEIAPVSGAVRPRKRVGRGIGSGHGKTCGRGSKGAKSRSGNKRKSGFEGGQMPIQRRVPKRGFGNPFKEEFQIINLSDIEGRDFESEIDPESMKKAGIIKKLRLPIKVLGDGEISKPIVVKANAFSRSAVEKIEKAGGKAEVI